MHLFDGLEVHWWTYATTLSSFSSIQFNIILMSITCSSNINRKIKKPILYNFAYAVYWDSDIFLDNRTYNRKHSMIDPVIQDYLSAAITVVAFCVTVYLWPRKKNLVRLCLDDLSKQSVEIEVSNYLPYSSSYLKDNLYYCSLHSYMVRY